MKKEIFGLIYGTQDTECEYFDTLEEARASAKDYINHLTKRELKTHVVEIVAHNVTVPDEYNYTSANDFFYALLMDEITAPEFDDCGLAFFSDNSQTRYEKIL